MHARSVLSTGLAAWAATALAAAIAGSTARASHEVTGVHLAGGSFVQGHDDADRSDEAPAHRVTVRPFALDATLVTRAEFARFVDQTHYRTSAETLGFGMAGREGLADWQWETVHGATWRRPYRVDGSDVPIDADDRVFERDDVPVVMVSWFDAVAYCGAQGKRLPTEAEWDYAMRAGATGTRYPWGDDPTRDGQLALNYWQGASHEKNRRDDGFVYVSPVREFLPNAWGIYDPVGNVWQWVADVYQADAYAVAAGKNTNDQMVISSKDENEGASESGEVDRRPRVLRGGSWWCGACTCEGNGLYYRGKADPLAPFNNNGFRCARSLN